MLHLILILIILFMLPKMSRHNNTKKRSAEEPGVWDASKKSCQEKKSPITCEALSLLALSKDRRCEYMHWRKQIFRCLKKNSENIKDLEKEHVVGEFEVGIEDFIELCDTYHQAEDDLSSMYEDSDCEADYDEEEERTEDAEFWLAESSVPQPVWDALWK